MLRRFAFAAAILAVSSAVPAWAERLTVKSLTGKELSIEIGLGETIEALMQKISDKEGVPSEQQRLVFAGKQLEAGRTLGDYGITEGATVMLVLRQRGQ